MSNVQRLNNLVKELTKPLDFDTSRIDIRESSLEDFSYNIYLDGKLWSEGLSSVEMESRLNWLFKGMKMIQPLNVGDIVEVLPSNSRAAITCVECDKNHNITYFVIFGDGSTDIIHDKSELIKTDGRINLDKLKDALSEVMREND